MLDQQQVDTGSAAMGYDNVVACEHEFRGDERQDELLRRITVSGNNLVNCPTLNEQVEPNTLLGASSETRREDERKRKRTKRSQFRPSQLIKSLNDNKQCDLVNKSSNYHYNTKRRQQHSSALALMWPKKLFPTLINSLIIIIVYLSYNYNNQEQNQHFLVQAFNIDTQSAIVHSGPENSYFGYTVALHRDREALWLLAGAPKAQTGQPKTKESGAVYRCAPSNSKTCQQIPFDPNGSSVITLKGEQVQTDDKSRQWFGASLQSANENGSIVACAPSYVYYSTNLKRRDPVGTCWISRGSFNGFLEYSPCRLNDQWGHHHLGSCQAGFASAITKVSGGGTLNDSC